jgi:hypothetical protein
VTCPAFAKASDFASVFVVATTDRCATPDKSADKIGFVWVCFE